ncbi:Pseudouridine kinase [subsurface metagenome]
MVITRMKEEVLRSPQLSNVWERFGGVVVIGGANIDLRGRSEEELKRYTSNPGKINVGSGGVGRNIAHNLALLSVPVTLLSAVGDDGEGIRILEETGKAGVKMEQMIISGEHPTGIYLAILDEKGEMEVAVSDMRILEEVTVDYLRSKAYLIKESKIVVVDTNIPEESIGYVVELCNKVKVPVLIEPVSVEKAKKLRGILNGRWTIDYITPNRDELASMLGMEIDDNQDMIRSVEELRGKRVKKVIVTLGEKGVYVSSEGGSFRGEGEGPGEREYSREKDEVGRSWKKFIRPSAAGKAVDVTGAGDALAAGLVYGIFLGYPLEVAARFGLAAAALTISSKEAVRRDLREGLLRSRMEEEEKGEG